MLDLCGDIRVDENWKQLNGLYKCPICNIEKKRKGIVTHIYRSHTNRKFSSGNNGSYNNTNYKQKSLKSRQEYLNRKLGIIKEYIVVCYKCNKSFIVKERELKFPLKQKYFCSRSCANTKIHTDETKTKIRNSIISNYIANDKIPELYSKICLTCNKEFKTYRQNQKCCSRKCGISYKNRNCDKTSKLHYATMCRFDFALNKYPDEFDFNLIRQYGWYAAKNHGNNLSGVSRDHIVSVDYGYKNKIDPNIIKHPANCQLLRHSDNSKKSRRSDMTIEQLIEKIKLWNEKYKE